MAGWQLDSFEEYFGFSTLTKRKAHFKFSIGESGGIMRRSHRYASREHAGAPGARLQNRPMLAFAAMICLLCGCSNDYRLRAVAKEGRIAFQREGSWMQSPGCIETIEVRADNGRPTTTPKPGDDEVLVRSRGVYWSTASEGGACESREPILYGAKLDRRPPANFPVVAAKPLKPGVVYEVWIADHGSGSGKGWFKILPDGRIKNYPSDPTPTLLDENGWQVEGGQQQE